MQILASNMEPVHADFLYPDFEFDDVIIMTNGNLENR